MAQPLPWRERADEGVRAMLTKGQIGQYLIEMNDRLAAQGARGEVVLCGGAVMALVYDARPSTKDVDALFALTAVIRDIAKAMAEEHGLEQDWFNDAAKGFIDTSRMGFEDVVAFSHLRVRRPGDEEMLALKLASAREDSMDAEDAVFLMGVVGVESIEQVYGIIERHIPAQRLTPMASFFAQEMFARYQARQRG